MGIKGIGIIAILAIIVIIVGALSYNALMPTTTQQGRFVVTLTDAAVNLNGVSQINVTIDSVKVHNDANGWISLSSKQQTYDLLQLKLQGSQVVIADLNIPATTYNQIEFNISKAIVVDTNGTHEAKLPSGKIRINLDQNLAKGLTNTISLDVLADESLHITGNGLYILAPVIHVQTRENTQVNIDEKNYAIINGGKIKDDIKVGMDEKGVVGINTHIPTNANININETGKIEINTLTNNTIEQNGRLIVALADAAANMSSIQKIQITVDSVRVHNDTNGWIDTAMSSKTYDLLDLNITNTTVLLVDTNIPMGNYDQIELGVQKVLVTDTNGTVEAKLPSNRLKIITNTRIGANSITAARFDLLANESLHVTGNGTYIFAPVINIEITENASIEAKANAEIQISGENKHSIKIGTDENGNIGVGLKIPKNVDINVGIDNRIHVGVINNIISD
ncbi:MAG: DUF4382 domain-containing protein [archaeon]|jgi:hypothetical protein